MPSVDSFALEPDQSPAPTPKKPPKVELPTLLCLGLCADFLEHHCKLKAPMTDVTQVRAFKVLGRLLCALAQDRASSRVAELGVYHRL